MQRNHGEPYAIKARFETRCPQTGKAIHKGDTAIYFPKARKLYHVDSRAAENFKTRQFAENL